MKQHQANILFSGLLGLALTATAGAQGPRGPLAWALPELRQPYPALSRNSTTAAMPKWRVFS